MSSILRVIAITDRRLMVPADVLAAGDWPAIAHAFGEAVQRAVRGCTPNRVAVQVREKDLDGAPLLQLVRAAQAFCSRVIVNDRIDVALIAGAYGIHLPERGIGLEDARQLAPRLLVGISRHAAPLAAAGAADLIHLGPIWPTASKPDAPTLGEAALAWPHGVATLVAVGGIDSPERAERAAAAGADAIAIVRSAWTGASLEPFVRAVDHGMARRYLSSDAGAR
jgi:thiamine-phosphate pyrophosphorylase